MRILFPFLIFVLGLIAVPASAQEFFPPFDPNDQEGSAAGAAMLYQMSLLGMTSPPIGWACVANLPDINGPTYVYCEPDATMIAAQEQEQERWEEQMRLREARTRLRLGLHRSRDR